MSLEEKDKMWDMYMSMIQKSYGFMFEQALIKVSWSRLADYQGGTK